MVRIGQMNERHILLFCYIYSDTQDKKVVTTHDTEQALIRQMASGSTDAFTVIYNQHWEELFQQATRMLRSRDAAKDIVQEVFLSLWNRRSEIKISDSLAAYLYTSVRNRCISYIRRNITHRDYLVMLTETEASDLSAKPELQLHLKQVQQAIHTAVNNLPERMQLVYRLSREQNLSRKEIAGQLGISELTVKAQIHNALVAIREAITQVPGPLTALLFFLFEK